MMAKKRSGYGYSELSSEESMESLDTGETAPVTPDTPPGTVNEGAVDPAKVCYAKTKDGVILAAMNKEKLLAMLREMDIKEEDVEITNEAPEPEYGGNPTPLREGDELTKAINMVHTSVGEHAFMNLNDNTMRIAGDLKSITEKADSCLDEEDKKKSEEIQKELAEMGKL